MYVRIYFLESCKYLEWFVQEVRTNTFYEAKQPLCLKCKYRIQTIFLLRSIPGIFRNLRETILFGILDPFEHLLSAIGV